MAQSIVSYRVFSNSSHWHWEVQCRGKVIGHGLAPNHVKARVEAMVAAMSSVDQQKSSTSTPTRNSSAMGNTARKSTV